MARSVAQASLHAKSCVAPSGQCTEVGPNWPHFQFKGRRQEGTAVAGAKSAVARASAKAGPPRVSSGKPPPAEVSRRPG